MCDVYDVCVFGNNFFFFDGVWGISSGRRARAFSSFFLSLSFCGLVIHCGRWLEFYLASLRGFMYIIGVCRLAGGCTYYYRSLQINQHILTMSPLREGPQSGRIVRHFE
jgi:hypothetical protein